MSTTFDRVVQKFDLRSGAELARKLQRSRQTAARWRKEGFPAWAKLQLLELAQERGIALSSEDLRNDRPT